MRSYDQPGAEALLIHAVHELRQPLGNIGTSAYLAHLHLPQDQFHVRQHLRAIEQQVEVAAALLKDLTEELQRLRRQRTESEILSATKVETAAVT